MVGEVTIISNHGFKILLITTLYYHACDDKVHLGTFMKNFINSNLAIISSAFFLAKLQ